MGRQPCCEKIGLKKGPWTAEEDRKLVNFISRHGHGCWRAVPKLAGLLRCGKSCRLRWTNYLRPDLKRGFLTDSEEKLIIDLHAVIGNRWSRIAAQLPGRTDNEIKNYWNTRIKKRLRQMGIDPNTHQPLAPSHASTSSNLEDGDEMASSVVQTLQPNCSLDHPATDHNVNSLKHEQLFELAGKFDDQELNLAYDIFPPPPTKALLHQNPSGKAILGVEAMQNISSRNQLIGPHSPTSVFSHGLTDEEGEDSSSLTKNSAGQALENEIESKNWMINFPLHQQSYDHETHNWATPLVHSPIPSNALDHFLPFQRSNSPPQIPKPETSLGSFTDTIPQKEMHMSCNVAATACSSDPIISDYLHWIDMMPVAWASDDTISQPYYDQLGANGELVAGNNSNVPIWLHELLDGYTSWADADMASATCQELQRLAAILDDL